MLLLLVLLLLVLVLVLMLIVALFVGLGWLECDGAEGAAVVGGGWCLTVEDELDAAALVLLILLFFLIVLFLIRSCWSCFVLCCLFRLCLALDRSGCSLSAGYNSADEHKSSDVSMCCAPHIWHFADERQCEYRVDLAAKKPSSSSASSLTALGGESEDDMVG